ncbi:MAG TPA: hypothetical protein PKH94_03540 [Bacteroidales bacterium]|nr:hypothetical protein [Bacteroidales bacterium]HNS46287.1 hypothetical protein [Bacteroidales bacterium]
MKTYGFVILILLSGSVLFAQTEPNPEAEDERIQTLFGENADNGGYGALMFNYSQINDKDAFLFGMRGGWLLDHKLTIGLGGYGFISDLEWDNVNDEPDHFLSGGYGGLLIEPVVFPFKPVHLAFPILIGAGGMAMVENHDHDNEWDDWDVDYAGAFFVFEPGVELELNLAKTMRVAFAVTYRLTQDLQFGDIDENALRGFNYGLVLKFGEF